MHHLVEKIKSERGNLFSILSTTIISLGASFLLMLAFANLISPQELGVYQYIIAISSLIASISLTGGNTAIIRAVGKKDYHFLPTVFRYTLLSFIPTITIAIVVSLYYLYQENIYLAAGIFFSTILILILQYLIRYNFIYVAIEKFKISNYVLKAVSIGPLIILVPILFFTSNPSLLSILYFASSALTVSLVIWYFNMPSLVNELIESSPSKNKDTDKHLSFAIHQSVITLVNSATAHIDKVLIFQMLGAQATAIYFISVSIPDRLRNIIKQFDSYLFSKFAKHSAIATQQNLHFKFFIMLLAIIPFYLAYILTAPIFFKLFISQYQEAIPLTIIYGLTLFAGAIIVPQSSLKAHANSKIFYILSFLYGIIKFTSLFLGVYYYDLLGAIWASTFSLIIYMLINYGATHVTVKSANPSDNY